MYVHNFWIIHKESKIEAYSERVDTLLSEYAFMFVPLYMIHKLCFEKSSYPSGLSIEFFPGHSLFCFLNNLFLNLPGPSFSRNQVRFQFSQFTKYRVWYLGFPKIKMFDLITKWMWNLIRICSFFRYLWACILCAERYILKKTYKVFMSKSRLTAVLFSWEDTWKGFFKVFLCVYYLNIFHSNKSYDLKSSLKR